MTRIFRALAVALLAVAAPLAGCVSGRPASGESSAAGEGESSRTSVVVDNRSFFDYDMYVVRSGVRTRIGQVLAGRRAELTIPSSLVGPATPLRILGDPMGGGGSSISESFTVSPGDQIALQIPPGR